MSGADASVAATFCEAVLPRPPLHGVPQHKLKEHGITVRLRESEPPREGTVVGYALCDERAVTSMRVKLHARDGIAEEEECDVVAGPATPTLPTVRPHYQSM